jgi:superfamily II DNA helicase RecQ
VFPHNWQTRAIVSLREKHDVMIRAGTGSGKSLIYQAMAVTKPEAIVLVIAPITVLMEDQVYILCVQSSPNR